MILENNFKLSSDNNVSEILIELLQKPSIVSSAIAFYESNEIVVGDENKDLNKYIYVAQGERATVSSEKVDFVGTDCMTTCIGIALYSPQTKLASVGHIDSPNRVKNGILSMISSLNLDDGSSIELHLVGAFDDSDFFKAMHDIPLYSLSHPNLKNEKSILSGNESANGSDKAIRDKEKNARAREKLKSIPTTSRLNSQSWQLVQNVLTYLLQSDFIFNLKTFCLLTLNTEINESQKAVPRARGIGINLQTGQVHRTKFLSESKGPAFHLRSACILFMKESNLKHTLISNYDTKTDTFRVGPFQYLNCIDYVEFLLSLPNQQFLFEFSTSPFAEHEEFVEEAKQTLKFLKYNPSWRDTFENGCHIFSRLSCGKWSL